MMHGNNGFLFNFFDHYFIIIIFFMYVVACVLLKKIYNNNKIMVKKIKIKKNEIENNVPITHGNNGFSFNLFYSYFIIIIFLCMMLLVYY